MHIYNPFQFGTIVSGENFCNCEEELSSLKSYIRDGYSVWLYSPRRYGKSSLIQKVFSEINGIETIYFDLYNVKSLDDFRKKYGALIAKAFLSGSRKLKSLQISFLIISKTSLRLSRLTIPDRLHLHWISGKLCNKLMLKPSWISHSKSALK